MFATQWNRFVLFPLTRFVVRIVKSNVVDNPIPQCWRVDCNMKIVLFSSPLCFFSGDDFIFDLHTGSSNFSRFTLMAYSVWSSVLPLINFYNWFFRNCMWKLICWGSLLGVRNLIFFLFLCNLQLWRSRSSWPINYLVHLHDISTNKQSSVVPRSAAAHRTVPKLEGSACHPQSLATCNLRAETTERRFGTIQRVLERMRSHQVKLPVEDGTNGSWQSIPWSGIGEPVRNAISPIFSTSISSNIPRSDPI